MTQAPTPGPLSGDDELIERGLRTIRTYDAVRSLRDALSATTSRLTGYDWNADPDSITKQQGDAFTAADKVFCDLDAAVAAHPDIDLPECEACNGTGKIEEPARTEGANQHSACVRSCDECDGCGFAPDERLAPTAPVEASGSEREDDPIDAQEIDGRHDVEPDAEDIEWPESPLANDLYRHIQSQFCLHDDEAAEEAGAVLSIMAKHGVDPNKLPLKLRPQPSGETRDIAWKILEEIPAINNLWSQFQGDIQAAIVTALEYYLHPQPIAKEGCVYVEVSGLTGTGKSAVMGEIEIALSALGLKVEHDAAFRSEKNATHADWREALDLYKPTVVLRERNVARPAPVASGGQHSSANDFPHGEVTDEWAERFCEAVNWSPDGQECKAVEGQVRCVSFRDLAKGYILSAIATQPAITSATAPVAETAGEAVARDKLVAGLADALAFIDDMGTDLHHARVADWYPEGAHNAASQMSEDMRLAGNRCATYEPLVDLNEAIAASHVPAQDDDKLRIACETARDALKCEGPEHELIYQRDRFALDRIATGPNLQRAIAAALKSTAAQEGGSK